MCCKELVGDSCNHCHDTIKVAIRSERLASKLAHDCEVSGLFAHFLPAVELQQGGSLEWARARQGLTLDFRLRLPSPDSPRDCLAELKTISAGIKWHTLVRKGTGVERQAATLPGYFKRELKNMKSGIMKQEQGRQGRW